MNSRLFRLVFSRVAGALVPVSERSRGGRGRRRAKRRAALAAGLFASHPGWAADPAIPVDALPIPVIASGNIAASGAATAAVDAAGRTLTVEQSTLRAIIDWQSFNVGRDASVLFNHQLGAASATLNRIGGADPSVIQGTVRALGELYLVNPNGIVFLDGARVDAGSLTVSALRMQEDAFNRGLLSLPTGANAQPAFAWDGSKIQYEASEVRLEAGSQLSASTGGRVMVFAPTIRNAGTVTAPQGQAMLASGAKVFLSAPTDPSLRGFLVEVDPYQERTSAGEVIPETVVGGRVENLGEVLAARGNATLAGFAINQSGRVSATTSVTLNGSVFLQARDSVSTRTGVNAVTVDGVQNVLRGTRTGTVTFGAGSTTEVMPDLADATTTQDGQGFTPSRIDAVGRTIELTGAGTGGPGAVVRAPGGIVNLTAQSDDLFQEPGDAAVAGTRVLIGAGALLDVSGTPGVVLPVERNFIEVELRGNELRDSPVIRNGALRGQTITVDIRKGTTLGDISGYLAQISRGIGERTSAGGTISLRSEGDVVVLGGGRLDVSGATLSYTPGTGAETLLRGADGRIYAVSTAPKDIEYSGFADRVVMRATVPNQPAGADTVPLTFYAAQRASAVTAQPGYLEGRSAGSIDIVAHQTVLEGTLVGRTQAGPYQRTAATAPLGGQLRLGDLSEGAFAASDGKLRALTLGTDGARLPASFGVLDELPESWRDRTRLDATTLFSRDGFTRLVANANGEIRIEAPVTLPAFATLSLTGRSVRVDHDITSPGGTVSLSTRAVTGEPVTDRSLYLLSLGDGVRIDVAGRWTNDMLDTGVSVDPIVAAGGAVQLRSVGDVSLGRDSSIDVSAGAAMLRSSGQVNGVLQKGTAGAITLSTGRIGLGDSDRQQSVVTLGGMLRGFGFSSGGSLSVSTSRIVIGAQTPTADTLGLDARFFQTGGFSAFTLNGQDGLTVEAGTRIDVAPVTWIADGTIARHATGAPIEGIVASAVLPEDLRAPTFLTLRSDSPGFGNITIGSGARAAVAPEGAITLESGRSILVGGELVSRGGDIRIANPAPGSVDSYEGDVSVWLASGALLDVSGAFLRTPDPRPLTLGRLTEGGRVTLSAGRGFLVLEAGAVVDASGARTVVDVPVVRRAGTLSYERREIATAAGSVTLAAREGMFLDSTMIARPGRADVAGGGLLVSMVAEPLALFPNPARRIEISAAGSPVPSGLRPGDEIESAAEASQPGALGGRAQIRAGALTEGGFDSVALRARDVIAFSDNVDVSVRRALSLDAPLIEGGPGAIVALRAATVSLGHSDLTRQVDVAAAAGSGTLSVTARFMEVVGRSTIGGFDAVTLTSQGELQLRGLVVDVNPDRDVTEYRLAGALSVLAGSLTVDAGRIMPSTLTDFTIRSLVTSRSDGAGTVAGAGAIAFASSASAPSAPPLSAAGLLTVEAREIVQGGRLVAPFGQIRLTATDETRTENGNVTVVRAGRVSLLEDSITSVASQGILVPFGKTELSGEDYVYALGGTFGNVVFSVLPERSVQIDGTHLSLRGIVDVSGGGDLVAYEFVPGPGGSRDIFSAADFPRTFAIVPGAVGDAYAPADHQASIAVTGLRAGDQVRLDAANSIGLPAGTYTLLPPGYAVLDGAYLVTAVDGFRDLTPGVGIQSAGGGVIVAGQRTAVNFDGTRVADVRTSGFLVESVSSYRARAEYALTRASAFFRSNDSGPLVGDAGRVSLVSRGGELSYGATLVGDTVSGGRGKSVDIASGNIRVIADESQAVPGALNLTTATLNALRASSLVLGGVRRAEDGQVVLTAAGDGTGSVTVLGGAELNAGDVVLVSKGSVRVEDDARIVASGSTGAGVTTVSGDGALVRVTQADDATVIRTGLDRLAGDVSIGRATLLAAGGGVVLDATRNTVLASDAVLSAETVGLAAGSVSAGEVPAGTTGLVLSDTLLAQVGRGERLAIRSYSALDLHGAASIGSTDGAGVPLLRELVIDAPELRGLGDGEKSLRAGTVTFANTSGGVGQGQGAGTGALVVDAIAMEAGTGGVVTFGPGDVRFSGFPDVRVEAGRGVRTRGTGTTEFTAGDVEIVTPVWASDDGAASTLRSAGRLSVIAPVTGTSTADAAGLGAALTLGGSRVRVDTRVELPSGTLDVIATGTAADDAVILGSRGAIDAAGRPVPFAEGVSRASSGGTVSITSMSGDVRLDAGSRIDVSSGGAGADAGLVRLRAANVVEVQDGVLSGAARGGTGGGRLSLDLGATPDLSRFAAVVNAGGFTESFSARTRAGDIVLGAGDTIQARTIYLSADAGSARIGGTLDAGGAAGGRIDVWADGDVTVEATGRLLAAAASDGRDGGDVFLGTTAGTIAASAGSRIDVGGGVAAAPGEIWLRAPRVGSDDVAIAEFGAEVAGTDHVSIEAFRIYTGTTIGTTTASAIRIGDSGATATLFNETRDYVQAARSVVEARLGGNADATFLLRPGIEIRSDSTLALNSDWNFYCGTATTCTNDTGLWSFGGVPGVLTLRAADGLTLNRSLNDGFRQPPPATLNANTSALVINNAYVPVSGGGWAYRLVAGADVTAADPGTVTDGAQADLVLANGRLVRTSTGFIDLAASRDVVLADSQSAVYTAGEPGAAVPGFVIPAVPTASGLPRAHTPTYTDGGGDVRVTAGQDVRAGGSVQSVADWLYRSARRSGSTILDNPQTTWWVRFDGFRQGFGTLGGGDVSVFAARDVFNVTAVAPTNGRVGGDTAVAPTADDFLELGGGSVALSAGRDVLGGLVLMQKGEGRISAGRDVGNAVTLNDQPLFPLLAIGDASLRVQAAGSVTVEGVFNPTIQRQARGNIGTNGLSTTYFLTYGEASAVSITAVTGDVTLSNNTELLPSLPNSPLALFGSASESVAAVIYPGTVRVAALAGDVRVDRAMYLAPSARGQLELLAASDVRVAGTINMSDVSPRDLPGVISRHGVADGAAPVMLRPDRVFREPTGSSRSVGILIVDAAEGALFHDPTLLHAGDPEPVRIVARTGDVIGVPDASRTVPLFGVFPKRATVLAGQDIRDVWIIGQNLDPTDVTLLEAGRDVVYTPLRNASGQQASNNARVEWGGPGEVQINAGRTVDLGNALGLITKGNFNNPYLPEAGASIRVATGSIAPAYDAFLDRYLGAESSEVASYRANLRAYMRERTGDGALTEDDAVLAFRALNRTAQTAFVNSILFAEIRAAATAPGGQSRGYRAIEALYPVADGPQSPFEAEALSELVSAIGERGVQPVLDALAAGQRPPGISEAALDLAQAYFAFQERYSGNVNLFFSQIKTEQGGEIELRVPGGLVNAGLASPGTLAKSASDLGIVTVRGGSVQAVVLDDFQVNQSRVFTLGGGDIRLWSSYGNIDAGKGAKTASATPPPQIVIRDGKFVLDTSRSVEGSGIGVLLTREGIEPGNVDLIATLGLVDAGDAGIRSAGNLNIVANVVLNALNIQVGGTQTGAQVVAAPNMTTATTTNTDSQTSSAVARAAEASAQSTAVKAATRLPSFITVEVIGFGS